MNQIFIILVCISIAFIIPSQSIIFNCKYKTDNWGTLGKLKFCEVENSVSISTFKLAEIDDLTGDYSQGQNTSSVSAFNVYRGEIHYFPRGLIKFFKNLVGIQMSKTGLKEIHQSDLKPFPKLKNLHLWSSKLEILEENLFEFNPNLQAISFYDNKISHIDPSFGNNLKNIKSLDLQSNICIDINLKNPTEIQIFYQKVQCTNSEFEDLHKKIENLQIESKELNFMNFVERLENLEGDVENSKFFNFFEQKLKILKNIQKTKSDDEKTVKIIDNFDDKFTLMDQKFSKTDQKIEELSEKLKKINEDETINFEKAEAKNEKNYESLEKFMHKIDQKIEELKKKVVEVDKNQENLWSEMNERIKTIEKDAKEISNQLINE